MSKHCKTGGEIDPERSPLVAQLRRLAAVDNLLLADENELFAQN